MTINRLKRTSRKHEKDGEGRLDHLFDEHIAKEFVDRDVSATIATMVPEPYVYNVPTMVGGFGGDGVRRFYSEHFVKTNTQRCGSDADFPNHWERSGG